MLKLILYIYKNCIIFSLLSRDIILIHYQLNFRFLYLDYIFSCTRRPVIIKVNDTTRDTSHIPHRRQSKTRFDHKCGNEKCETSLEVPLLPSSIYDCTFWEQKDISTRKICRGNESFFKKWKRNVFPIFRYRGKMYSSVVYSEPFVAIPQFHFIYFIA